MSSPFIGQIIMFGGNFAIRSWAKCDGQLLPIAQNSALFSLLATNFGGDGRSNFALPDFRGRIPNHMGTGPGLSSRVIGQKGGAQDVTLATANIPSHTHQLRATNTTPASDHPGNEALAQAPIYADQGNTVEMSSQAVSNAGTGPHNSHPNRQPYLAVTFLIALQGLFPSRN